MAVAMLGAVVFRPFPVSIEQWSRSARYPHAEHQVVGAAPIYEAMGDGETEFSISGAFFPDAPEMTAGLQVMVYLESMRSSGTPVHYMRGDGLLFGWVLVQELRQTHEMIGASGYGREIGFQARLVRCDAPSAASITNILGGAIGGAVGNLSSAVQTASAVAGAVRRFL